MSLIYNPFKVALAKQQLADDIENLNIKVALIDEAVYTADAAHQYRNQLTGVVAESGNLANVSVSAAGQIDSDNIIVTGVAGATVEAVAFFVDTGDPATSSLICYINGLNLTPDGGNVQVTINGIVNL